MGIATLVGMVISSTSLLIAGQWKFTLFYAGIIAQLLLMAYLNDKARAFPSIANT